MRRHERLTVVAMDSVGTYRKIFRSWDVHALFWCGVHILSHHMEDEDPAWIWIMCKSAAHSLLYCPLPHCNGFERAAASYMPSAEYVNDHKWVLYNDCNGVLAQLLHLNPQYWAERISKLEFHAACLMGYNQIDFFMILAPLLSIQNWTVDTTWQKQSIFNSL